LFTALHRLLGRPLGPLTDEMLDEAVNEGLRETDDLDWKKALPPPRGLPTSEFPKDVAAMANSGGGVIVYGVTETQKAATRRVDVGELTETHERALRSAAVTAISPPVFGLGVRQLGDDSRRAVVVWVPATVDGPHLIYRDEYFGAPIRNDADTVWMKERQIEAMYRARFDERRNAHEALDNLYSEVTAGRPIGERAWLIGVARPRVPVVARERMSREAARSIFQAIRQRANRYTTGGWRQPLDDLDVHNPRPGLRRWIAPPDPNLIGSWQEMWASIHDDGSVAVATAIGGHRTDSDKNASGNEIRTDLVELCAIGLMTLLRMASEHYGTDDYDLKVGIEWAGDEPLALTPPAAECRWTPTGLPVARYTPVLASARPGAPEPEFLAQIRDLATDLINQGGLSALVAIPESLD